MASPIFSLPGNDWRPAPGAADAARATEALESGHVVWLPALAFALAPEEQAFLSPQWATADRKNISFDPARGALRATAAEGEDHARLTTMMGRFAGSARSLVAGLFPGYANALRPGLTSFRPVEATGRAQSPRHDDTRLHVDAFPSRPTGGERILRVFCNVNPAGRPRVWEIGEPFEAVAAHYAPQLKMPAPGAAWLLHALGITKGRRSAYDHCMLQLHDRAKCDDAYQRASPRTHAEFTPGSTWIVFTDRVMHAALAGQFLFEQTFYLPVAAMQDPARAPLKVLERTLGRALV
ncbi:MAG: Kdo hydroxylase family protein [Burkholderiales bacterium]